MLQCKRVSFYGKTFFYAYVCTFHIFHIFHINMIKNANCVSYYFQNRIWLKECEIDYKFPPIMPAGNITINFGFFWVVKQGKKIINRNIGDVKVYVVIKNRSYNVQ